MLRRPAQHAPRATPGLWRWASAGVLVGALGAGVAWAPARWLAQAVDGLSQGRVQLLDSTGTVWSGQARLRLTGGNASHSATLLPGLLQWNNRLGWNAVEMRLEAPCCTHTPLTVRLSPALQGWTLQVSAHQSQWPARLLSGLGTPWNTVQPEGKLGLDTTGLTLTSTAQRWSLDGQATLHAEVQASRLSTLRPLGRYRLELHGGSTPTLHIATQDGALQLQGQGQWTAGQWHFQGEASAAPEQAAALDNLLNILGRRQGARSIISLG